MKSIVIIFLLAGLNGFSQDSQSEFTFLIGKERTDSTVYQFLTRQFSLFDDEYDEMWVETDGVNDNWEFRKYASENMEKLTFPLYIVVTSGIITSINVFPKTKLTSEAQEKWLEFYGSEMPGGFLFSLTKKEMKQKFEKRKMGTYSSAPLKMKLKQWKLVGFRTDVDSQIELKIFGTGTRKKPVSLLIYY
jgi:hypothetical protein